MTHPSEYCKILPFLDHAIQFKPGSMLSLLLRTRMTLGVSAVGGLAMLQTLRSPSKLCIANISDFCLVDEACHAKLTIGEGARDVDSVCKMVKDGCKATIRIDPFIYLSTVRKNWTAEGVCLPNGISLAVSCGSQCRYRIKDCTG